MKKRHEALRRELRSLIQDASRELAGLEGRQSLGPPVFPAQDGGMPPATPVPSRMAEKGASDGTVATRDGASAARESPAPPAANGATAPAPPAPVARPRRRVPARGAARARGGAARRRVRHRAAPLPRIDGVPAQQVHARKGVCFAYFINAECWRVPEAYCNTALEVCITRECPVFQLHRDSLERRFARKYKHLW